jgi:predicted AlkP superfamily phosphohydrolase/phosphomutase
MSTKRKPKVAMIGFDAAEFSYIAEHLPVLPNFRRALGGGILRRLNSGAHTVTGSVWPTFYTATEPGDHGIHHLMQWDADAMRLRVAADWLYFEPFWRELERRGHKVIALDVPMTFPPAQCAGVEISSWGAHDQLTALTTYPRELKTEIQRRFGEHPMGIEIPVAKSLAERMCVRANLVQGVGIKSAMVRWLLTSREWDFFMRCSANRIAAATSCGPTASTIPPSALLDVYQALDQALGEVLAAIDLKETTVVLLALHGMGSNLSQEHFVAQLMDRINVRFSELEPGFFTQTGAPRQRSLMRFLREKVPPRLQSTIANMVPQQIRDAVVDRSFTSGYDWPHTPGLALRADNNGYIRFNLIGREKQGMLEAGSAALARNSELISETFRSLRTADGKALVNDVLVAAEHFPGKRAHRLPDRIVTWTGLEPASQVSSSLGTLNGELDTGRGGNHRATGFQILLEPSCEQSAEAAPLAVSELAPAILQMFDA